MAVILIGSNKGYPSTVLLPMSQSPIIHKGSSPYALHNPLEKVEPDGRIQVGNDEAEAVALASIDLILSGAPELLLYSDSH